jgi:cytochrome c553
MLSQSLLSSILLALFIILPATAADKTAGEQKSGSCVGCHGQNGISNNAQWPNLAAQQSTYLVNQLIAFKSGYRSNPMMQSLAANLSNEDMDNLAAYFSSQKSAKIVTGAGLVKSGEASASMCLGCHGQTAEGNGQFPRLAGQHPDYIEQQLHNFRTGLRKNGPMQAITANLSETNIKALATYFGAL